MANDEALAAAWAFGADRVERCRHTESARLTICPDCLAALLTEYREAALPERDSMHGSGPPDQDAP